MNNVQLIGRLCYEPEVNKAEKSDTSYLNNVIAVPRANGEETDFISITAFNGTAEFIKKFFKKGERIGITGRLAVSEFEDEDGNKGRNWSVIAITVDFCESIKDDGNKEEKSSGSKKAFKKR